MTEPAIEALTARLQERMTGPDTPVFAFDRDTAHAIAVAALRALLDGGYVVLTDRPCKTCDGGRVTRAKVDPSDIRAVPWKCPDCNGTGLASSESPQEPR